MAGARGEDRSLGDAWARWLLRDRFAGDEAVHARMLRELGLIRDRVLDGARIGAGDTVLDVGAGDGLLGFASLERSAPDGAVVFVDVSEDLVARCRRIADELGVASRCRFVQGRAEDLDGVADASADAVVLRSVLIYVDDKPAAFGAFHRVLRPGGRLSLFEPLNRTIRRLDSQTLFGFDAREVSDLADRLRRVYEDAVGGEAGAMLGFDVEDLLVAATDAGFADLEAQIEVVERTGSRFGPSDWETFLAASPNPLAPTAGEVIEAVLDDEEAARLRACLEPQIQAGSGRSVGVACFLQASRPDGSGA